MRKGRKLLVEELDRHEGGVLHISPSIDLSPFMALRHFEDIKTYSPNAFAGFDRKISAIDNHYPWYEVSK